MTTAKKTTPITTGEIKLPSKIPNLNHSLFKGVRIFEFNKPNIKKIIDIINAQKGWSYREKFQAMDRGLKNERNPSHSATKGTKKRAKNPVMIADGSKPFEPWLKNLNSNFYYWNTYKNYLETKELSNLDEFTRQD